MTRLEWTNPAVADLEKIRDYIGFAYSDSMTSPALNSSVFILVSAAWPQVGFSLTVERGLVKV